MAKTKVSEDRELLTTEEAAKLLAVKKVTVRALIANRKMAAYKYGKGVWRVPRSEVERYLEESLIPRR